MNLVYPPELQDKSFSVGFWLLWRIMQSYVYGGCDWELQVKEVYKDSGVMSGRIMENPDIQ